MNQIICESNLQMVGQAQYVEGLLQGADQVCIGGRVCKSRLGKAQVVLR